MTLIADDIALLSEELHQAQQLLQRVKTSVAKVGLKMNVGKTNFTSFNQGKTGCIQTNDGTKSEEVKDVKYLGRGWKAQQRTLNNAKQQRGEHVVNLLKSGSHLSQEDSSLDCVRQLSSQCCYMAVKRGQL